MATRTMGVASKLSGVNGGQAGAVDSVADFKTYSSSPPIPERGQRNMFRVRVWKTSDVSTSYGLLLWHQISVLLIKHSAALNRFPHELGSPESHDHQIIEGQRNQS